jgi:hypothetical protein
MPDPGNQTANAALTNTRTTTTLDEAPPPSAENDPSAASPTDTNLPGRNS